MKQQIWKCEKCYHIIHLKCMKVWSKGLFSARCPYCNSSQSINYEYKCFCGKVINPYPNYRFPHSCGAKCNNALPCGHKCKRVCHPGPCTPCTHSILYYYI